MIKIWEGKGRYGKGICWWKKLVNWNLWINCNWVWKENNGFIRRFEIKIW